MPDHDRRDGRDPAVGDADDLIANSTAFAIGYSMLGLAGTFAREQITAANQQALNASAAMLQLQRELSGATAHDSSARALSEAIDLVKQVVANAQAR